MAKKKPRKIVPYDYEKLAQAVAKSASASKLLVASDPGSKNYGIALVGVKGKAVKVYANAMMMRPVNDLVNFNSISQEFVEELDRWVAAKPQGFVAERFQIRGVSMGPLIEQVSAMLGLIKGRYQLPVKLTIASAWKNRVQRRFDIDLKEVYETTRALPHQLDATLIGIFGLEEGLGQQLPYTIEDIVRQVEATSLTPLKKERS